MLRWLEFPEEGGTVSADRAPLDARIRDRASWPDERIIRATLSTVAASLDAQISRTALILVGPALGSEGFAESCLYSSDYDRRYRPQSAESPWASWTPEQERGDG